MISDPSLINTILVWPMLNVLMGVYKLVSFLPVPYTLGFSIVLLTVLIKLVFYPLTSSQLRFSKKMQTLSPHITKLRDKHKGDSKKIQEETMKLYKEHGVNPALGCLPVIVQIPLIWGLYSVLQQVVRLQPEQIVSEVNKVVYLDILKISSAWDNTFFGLPLGQSPSSLLGSLGAGVLLFPLLTALFQFIQSKMLAPLPPEKKIDKKDRGGDFASAFQAQSVYLFPIMIGFLSYGFPIGLSLYWITFSVFGIIQQFQIMGLGGLAPWYERLIKR